MSTTVLRLDDFEANFKKAKQHIVFIEEWILNKSHEIFRVVASESARTNSTFSPTYGVEDSPKPRDSGGMATYTLFLSLRGFLTPSDGLKRQH